MLAGGQLSRVGGLLLSSHLWTLNKDLEYNESSSGNLWDFPVITVHPRLLPPHSTGGASEIISAKLEDEVKQGPSHPCWSHSSYLQLPITGRASY